MTRSKRSQSKQHGVRPVPKPKPEVRTAPWQKLERALKQERPDYALIVEAYPDIRKEELSARLVDAQPTLEQCLKEMDQIYRQKLSTENDDLYVLRMLARGTWVPHALVRSREANPQKPTARDSKVDLTVLDRLLGGE